ncbi:MAG: HAMP domain-containing protein [Pseudomonadota bacterium]
MTIPIICEECGKLYHIPKDKLRNIKGDVAKTKCRNCGFIIIVNKTEADTPDELEELELPEVMSADDDFVSTTAEAPISPFEQSLSLMDKPAAASIKTSAKNKRRGLGLRAKMIVLFLVVPLGIMAASGYFSQRQTNMMVSTLVNQSAEMVTALTEQNVDDLSKAVARQVQLYLESTPGLRRENFADDQILNSLAVQKVGTAGFTFLYATGPFTILANPNRSLNGQQVSESMRAALGSDWNLLKKIIEPLEKGQNLSRKGYYLWKDLDGSKREQFAVMTPIRGTDYGIAAAVYVREFTAPLNQMKEFASQEAVRTKNTNFAITLATLIIIGAIVTFYGHALVKRIKMLTDVADRISVGELDAEITIKSQDELGSLADAVARMQDSLRLSIMRLRRKR